MPEQLDFAGPILKMERARRHIDELDNVIRIAAQDRENPTAFFEQQENGEVYLVMTTGPFTVDFRMRLSAIVGDALHNLRSCLDHAYCDLIRFNDHKITDRPQFPIIRGPRADLLGKINKQIQEGSGPSDAARDYIVDELQIYGGGKDTLLRLLSDLNNSDKHTSLIPAIGVLAVDKINLAIGGEAEGITFKGTNDAGVGMLRARPEDNRDMKLKVHVLFGDDTAAPERPITNTLMILFNEVGRVLAGLSNACGGVPIVVRDGA